MHNHSYENEFNLHVNEILFSYERMSTKTRFEKQAKVNSEMTYSETERNAFLKLQTREERSGYIFESPTQYRTNRTMLI